MAKQVLIPRCVKCGRGTLTGESKKTTMQLGTHSPNGFYEKVLPVGYTICNSCSYKYGTIIRVWRRPDKKDTAYFTKARSKGVEIQEDTLTLK